MADPLELAVREQFQNPVQQRETSMVGMWVFLITEVMLFGGLFTGFAVYRMEYPLGFDLGSAQMDFKMGAINTAVLICSSFAMALAVNSAERGRKLRLAGFLVLTIVLGLLFLGIKFDEYYLHFLDHKAPGINFYQSGPQASSIEMFYVFYYIMTGLHALHMFVGIGLLSVLLLRTGLGSFSAEYHTPVEITGLYWHFVDTVWVFLFAIFYIPGAHMR
ncbi:MAG TPA: cytochrome c oxidase subunit 3 [Verrucomicrobiae bacterium]|nr:cytochrome c oxidase subunit 3 [Verrucomicrobiae bacterium]